jgi:hypothetical protein
MDVFASLDEIVFGSDTQNWVFSGALLLPLFHNYADSIDGKADTDAGILLANTSEPSLMDGYVPGDNRALTTYIELRWWFRYKYNYATNTTSLSGYGEIKNADEEDEAKFGLPVRVYPSTILARNALFSYNAVALSGGRRTSGAVNQADASKAAVRDRSTTIGALVADIEDALSAAKVTL